ncbi:hypothetical protein JTB14_019345 [Gonioctena quinquepunctata]|nr:hypothetical protein JTB14_019345 [Gonioctena quinquepunctata]
MQRIHKNYNKCENFDLQEISLDNIAPCTAPKNFSSSGPDEALPNNISNLPITYDELIYALCQNPNHGDSYGPLALLSFILKTFERIIKYRMELSIRSNSILPNNRYGFRKGFGTNDAVAQLFTNIQVSFSENGYLGAAFLDNKRVYASVDLLRLRDKLLNAASPTCLVNVICKYTETGTSTSAQ